MRVLGRVALAARASRNAVCHVLRLLRSGPRPHKLACLKLHAFGAAKSRTCSGPAHSKVASTNVVAIAVGAAVRACVAIRLIRRSILLVKEIVLSQGVPSF